MSKIEFDYFYERDGDRFNYIRMPLIFFEEEYFRKNLSNDAKIVYSLLLNRVGLSYRNGWIENDTGRVYIIFTIEELMISMSCSNKTASKILAELDVSTGIGLIERKKVGLGKPDIIFVKDFLSKEFQTCKKYTSRDVKSTRQEMKKVHLRDVKSTRQEVKNLHASNINNINNNMSKKDSSYKGKNTRNAYGTFQNVFLSANDYDELKDKLQDRLDELIDRLSCYIESSGKKYKSHKATILLWYEDDKRINESPNKRVYTLDDYKIRY